MRDEIDDLLNDLDLNDISDLDDITSESVSDILGKYKLDKITKMDDIELSEAEKMLNEAYEMVNSDNYNESLDDEDHDDKIEDSLEDSAEENGAKQNETIEMAKSQKDNTKSKKKKIKSKLEIEDISAEEDNSLEDKDNPKSIDEDESKIIEKNKDNSIEDNHSKEDNKDTSEKISQEDRDALKKELEETLKAKQELERQLEEAKKKNTDNENQAKVNNTYDKNDDVDKDNDLANEDLDNDDVQKQKNKIDSRELKEKASETFKNLFYNIQDEEYEKQQRKLERREKRKKEAKKKEAEKAKADKAVKTEEKKKKAAEDKAAKAKEAAEAKKKKAEAKKKQAEKKKKEKAEREKAMENEPVGRINKLGAVVVFLFIALITSGVVLFSIQVGKLENYQEQAREYMSKGMYEQAYMTLLKEDEDKIKDTELYEQLRLIQKLNKKISYYSSNKALLDREKALDALVSGVEMYDSNKIYAKEIGIREQYDSVFVTIKEHLKSEYNMSLSDARKLATIKSKETYSEEISRICKETKIKNKIKKDKKQK